MELERRGCVVRPWPLANRKREEPVGEAKPFKQRPNIGSRVIREGHARFWERPEVKFLRATRQLLRSCAYRDPSASPQQPDSPPAPSHVPCATSGHPEEFTFGSYLDQTWLAFSRLTRSTGASFCASRAMRQRLIAFFAPYFQQNLTSASLALRI